MVDKSQQTVWSKINQEQRLTSELYSEILGWTVFTDATELTQQSVDKEPPVR